MKFAIIKKKKKDVIEVCIFFLPIGKCLLLFNQWYWLSRVPTLCSSQDYFSFFIFHFVFFIFYFYFFNLFLDSSFCWGTINWIQHGLYSWTADTFLNGTCDGYNIVSFTCKMEWNILFIINMNSFLKRKKNSHYWSINWKINSQMNIYIYIYIVFIESIVKERFGILGWC